MVYIMLHKYKIFIDNNRSSVYSDKKSFEEQHEQIITDDNFIIRIFLYLYPAAGVREFVMRR